MSSMANLALLELVKLEPQTSIKDIEVLCEDAQKHQVACVCLPPMFVRKAKEVLKDSAVQVSTVAGYPIGYNSIESKLADIVLAILDGTDEIVLTINFTALFNNDWQYLASELNAILPVVNSKNKKLVIDIQSDELTRENLMKCCDLYGIAGVSMIQLNVESLNPLLQEDIIRLVRSSLADAVGVKITLNTKHPKDISYLAGLGVSRIAIKDLNYLTHS